MMLLFCTLVWGLLSGALVYGAETGKVRPASPSDKNSEDVRKKIKSLDLNDKQRKFLESLTEDSKKINAARRDGHACPCGNGYHRQNAV